MSLPLIPLFALIAAAICIFLIDMIDLAREDLSLSWFTRRREIYGFSLLAVLLSLWLVLGQAFAYVTQGQAKKICFIKGFFPHRLIAKYFYEFCSGDEAATAASKAWDQARSDEEFEDAKRKLDSVFDAILKDSFGLSAYAVPAVLFAAVAFIVLFIAFAGGLGFAESLVTKTSPVHPLGLTLDLVSVASIFGAFTWVASDAITRNHQWTFHPSDLSWYTLRLIIAVPLGQTIAALTPQGSSGPLSTGAFLAFVISMLPFERITAMLSSVAAKTGVVPATSQADRDDVLNTLPGVDESSARAFALEGISTILQLKAIDPIRISIRTGLPFEYVLCLIDTAILWNFAGSDLPILRPFGFPGASYVLNFIDQQRVVLDDMLAADIAAGSRDGASAEEQAKGIEAARKRGLAATRDILLMCESTPAMMALLSAIEERARTDSKSRLDKLGIRNVFAEIAADDYAAFIRDMYNTRLLPPAPR